MKTVLTNKQVAVLTEKIQEVMLTKLNCPDLFTEDIPKKGRRRDKIVLRSSKCSNSGLGNFKYIIAEYRIVITVWLNEGTRTGQFVACPSFHYIHHDGGGNGHSMNFRITGNMDGTGIKIHDN